jgi:hypothetical protein
VACGNVGSPRHALPATTAVRRKAGWKQERVSESERYGTVNCSSAALLSRRGHLPRGRWGLLMGLSMVTTNPAGLGSRTPPPACVILSELGQAVRTLDHPVEMPTGSTINGEPTGTSAAAEDSGPSQGPG